MTAFSYCLWTLASMAFGLGAAHFWRAGHAGVAVAAALAAALVWQRGAWARLVLPGLLVLLGARWFWISSHYVQLRLLMEQPWLRLAAILLAVTVFTLLCALALHGPRGRQWYARNPELAPLQAAAFGLTAGLLALVAGMAPGAFVLERFWPGGAAVQIFLAALWAVWVCGLLAQHNTATAARLRVWRVFSLVFFGQLVLGLAGGTSFLMTGQLHVPVPGLILAAPLYRDGGFFMLILFTVAVLLVGAAWCSHLCYFGVWDASAACSKKKPAPPAGIFSTLARWRLVLLALTLTLPLLLRVLTPSPHISLQLALALGIALSLALGLLLIPVAILVSRRYGVPAYCLGICPLGQAARWLGRLAPWRVRRTKACTGCKACARVCRYGAMTACIPQAEQHLAPPTSACTLCRDCLNVCPRGGLSLTLWGKNLRGNSVERTFVLLITVLHSCFLFLARV